ncbi:hypothetical protein C2S52_011352 [Perilla frutescens var. hirtella]|nr:hypothetical protein C2S52_011352 [Perilla frutescens var. hirtella]
MGFVYGELIQVKEDIKIAEHSIPKKYEPIIEVIDVRIKDRLDSPLHLTRGEHEPTHTRTARPNRLVSPDSPQTIGEVGLSNFGRFLAELTDCSPLHLTAYMLNPFYHYKNPLLHLERDVVIGMIECVDTLFPGDVDLQDKIMNEEFPMYRDKDGLFGKPVAVKGCSLNDARFDPASWWSNFGARTPNLQRLTMRILSLTSSSSGCERNWSAFEGVYKKKGIVRYKAT